MNAPSRSWPWLTIAVAMATAMAVVGQTLGRPSPDVAWNLYVARELLRGGRLGVDLFENTPPMIFVLKVPTVALANALHLRELSVWVLVVAAIAAMAILLAARLLEGRRLVESGPISGVMLTMGLALLVLPGPDFGQRDHVTAILVLPYVCLAASRLGAGAVSKRLAVLTGVLAGIGIGIKPHFALLPIGLLLLSAYRFGPRRLLDPENLAIAAVGTAYLAGVVIFSPEYLRYAAAYGPLYQHFQTNFFVAGEALSSLPPWTSAAIGYEAVLAYVGLGVLASARRYLTEDERRWTDALAAATAALLLVGILQGKGWRYHFLPSQIFAILSVIVVLRWCGSRPLSHLARVYLGAGAAVVAAQLASVMPTTVLRVVHPRDVRLDADPDLPRLLPLVRSVGPRGHVAVLSTNISSSFPLVLESSSRWALRHPNLWPLVALYPDEVRQAATVRPRPWSDRGRVERQFAGEVVEDLTRTKPELLLVIRPEPTVHGWGGARRFDYLEYFSDVPGFQRQVLDHYQRDAPSGSYAVYWRRGFSTGAPGVAEVAPVPSLPPQALAGMSETLVIAAGVAGFVWAWHRTRGRNRNGVE